MFNFFNFHSKNIKKIYIKICLKNLSKASLSVGAENSANIYLLFRLLCRKIQTNNIVLTVFQFNMYLYKKLCYCFQILDVLIAGCRGSDEEIQVSCGECLGEIGAVDPGRLPNKVAINGTAYIIFMIHPNCSRILLLLLLSAND